MDDIEAKSRLASLLDVCEHEMQAAPETPA
jgi:hypothetical protein